MKIRQKIFSALLAAAVCVSGVRCSPPFLNKTERYREKQLVLGTFVGVDVCFSPGEEAARDRAYEKVWDALWELHGRLNAYGEEGEVARINRSFPEILDIHPQTFRLLRQSVAMTDLTSGAFDVTAKPLIDFWRQKAAEGVMPTEKEIARVRKAVGPTVLDLSQENKARLTSAAARIDLGGIAKGYAVDTAARILRDSGFHDFMIDAGGDIFVSGKNCRGEKWRIGVRDPDAPKIMDVVFLSDAAVTTSGSYEQHYELGGMSWSHIVDPRTGYPLKALGPDRVASVSVIAPTAAEADALSTALSVLGNRHGLDLIDRLGEGYAALMVRYEGKDGAREEWTSRRYREYRASSR